MARRATALLEPDLLGRLQADEEEGVVQGGLPKEEGVVQGGLSEEKGVVQGGLTEEEDVG